MDYLHRAYVSTKYAVSSDERHFREHHVQNACVVTRDGHEIQCFFDEKEAGAWMQHTYGLTPWNGRKAGLLIVPLRGRPPRPGDVFIYQNPNENVLYENGVGHLSYEAGSLVAGFNVRTYRANELVSSSGGPLPWVKKGSLSLGGLWDASFWRWHDGHQGANQGGHYTMRVPFWRWDGTQPSNEGEYYNREDEAPWIEKLKTLTASAKESVV